MQQLPLGVAIYEIVPYLARRICLHKEVGAINNLLMILVALLFPSYIKG